MSDEMNEVDIALREAGAFGASSPRQSRSAVMTEWQDIVSAPRDAEFLAFGYYFYPGDKDPTIYYSIASRNGEFINDWEGDHPAGFFTHWLPLPPPPHPSRR